MSTSSTQTLSSNVRHSTGSVRFNPSASLHPGPNAIFGNSSASNATSNSATVIADSNSEQVANHTADSSVPKYRNSVNNISPPTSGDTTTDTSDGASVPPPLASTQSLPVDTDDAGGAPVITVTPLPAQPAQTMQQPQQQIEESLSDVEDDGKDKKGKFQSLRKSFRIKGKAEPSRPRVDPGNVMFTAPAASSGPTSIPKE